MKTGKACRCHQRVCVHLSKRRWLVVTRNRTDQKNSYGSITFSEYSTVRCQQCGAAWRTKATYVGELKDDTFDQVKDD